jgi:hypothetical protein
MYAINIIFVVNIDAASRPAPWVASSRLPQLPLDHGGPPPPACPRAPRKVRETKKGTERERDKRARERARERERERARTRVLEVRGAKVSR